ncbi:hypothetical protein KKF38_04890 [Patescibacteria group bacterium]|nr:hypothetical protein [Patescibacteria group bacterium]
MAEYPKFVFIRRTVPSVFEKVKKGDNKEKFNGDIKTILKLQKLVRSKILPEKESEFQRTIDRLTNQVPPEKLAAAITAEENQKK